MEMRYIGILFLNLYFDANGEIEEILILIIDVTTEIKSNIVMENSIKITRRISC